MVCAGLVYRLPYLGRAVQIRAERVLSQGIDARFCATVVFARVGPRHVHHCRLSDHCQGRRTTLVDDCARQVDHGHHRDGLFHAPGGTIFKLNHRNNIKMV